MKHSIKETESLSRKLFDIVDIARLAPSVHNSQPWRVSMEDDRIKVSVDPAFRLVDGDPTGRQTIISLGIFCEAMLIGLMHYNFQTTKVVFQDESVVLSVKEVPKPLDVNGDIASLRTRATDRSIYRPTTIDDKIRKIILASGAGIPGAKVWLVRDKPAIDHLAKWTAQGIGVALSSASFRHELSHMLVRPHSKKNRGISTASLHIPKTLAIVEPMLMGLGLGLKQEVKLEQKRWESASAICMITTDGDMPDYWFSAGRVYLRAALAIEKLGLSQATSASTVEASTFHEDVEQLLGTKQRLQSVIRIGLGAKHRPHSPRVNANDLISTSN